MNTIQKAFILVGIMAVSGFGAILLYAAWCSVKEFILKKRYEYKWKHRFDKRPVAKCWCNDCKWHGRKYPNFCEIIRIDTPPEGFCYMAEPRTWEEAKEKIDETDN